MPSLPHRGLLAAGLFLLMAPFMAGMQTVFQSATARFTTRRSRSAGFNLWYLFMNIGAAAAGFSIDAFRVWLKIPNPNVHIFSMGVVTAALCLVAGITLVRREEQLVSPDDPPDEQAAEAKVERKPPLENFHAMIRHPAMWRLIVLIGLILGVRAVYTYLGMSLIPWFLAKTFVSMFSGHMLKRWSPETVSVNGAEMPLQQAMVEHQLGYWQRPEAMRLWLGLYALAGCLIALALRRWFEGGTEKKGG